MVETKVMTSEFPRGLKKAVQLVGTKVAWRVEMMAVKMVGLRVE